MENNEQKIKELLTRGVETIIDLKHLENRLLSGEKLRVKLGIDPTSPNIHLGNSISLLKLRQFQNLGHKIILILGDFTAQIGDPSDKLEKRPFLSNEQIKENLKTYKKQISKILDIKKVEWHQNSKWLNNFNLMEIIKLSTLMSIQQILQRRNFKERLKKNEDITMNELYYPLLQGYDSVAVKADLEVGGNDQLFNLLVARKIQEAYHQPPQDIMTFQMLEGLDGQKMSKTRKNIVNVLDEPNEMFGKIMSLPDNLIIKYFLLCTNASLNEISQFEQKLKSGENPRNFKAQLAKEIVKIYHGEATAEKAEQEFDKIFKEKGLPNNIPSFTIEHGIYNIVDLLVKTKMASSKSEAQRLIEQGAVKINEVVMKEWRQKIEIRTPGIIIRVGKRLFIQLDVK